MNLEELRARKGFICDMDGVIYLGNQLLPGVREFVNWLNENGKQFLFLTNSSERSPKELRQKLQHMGLDIDEEHFYTSALATAAFLKKQAPGCTAFVIGAPGLLNALYDVGVTMNDVDPDYVIVGETASYNYEVITKAVRLVLNGARLIATRDVRLARRITRDWRFRGHDADFTIGLWPHVCKAEDQYIKTFKNRANLVLDTSFSCEVGIWEYYIDQLTASANAGRMADLRSRFAHFVPINAALIPQKSMLREFIGAENQ
mgnify:CR=1 FL=1